MEILGLLGLLELEADDPRSQNLSNFLIKFINTNPGTAHLISDGWAVSLIPPVLVLGREGNAQLARRLLENVIRWVADRYGSDSRENCQARGRRRCSWQRWARVPTPGPRPRAISGIMVTAP
jgi:hypothetical protein